MTPILAFLALWGIVVPVVGILAYRLQQRGMIFMTRQYRADHLALACTLRAWLLEAAEGDGIDTDNEGVLLEACTRLGIEVRIIEDGERYELIPTLTDWFVMNEGKHGQEA